MHTPQKSLVFGLTVITVLVINRATPAQGPTLGTATSVVDRVVLANGRPWTTGEIGDSVSEGKLTFFGVEGAKIIFDLKILRKGNTQVQRVIKQPVGELKQGSDGTNTWEGIPGFYAPAARGQALQFIESQTIRSVPRLFNHQKEGLILSDLGSQDKSRLIESEDRQGKRTTYFIDSDTNLITRLEFVTGQIKDPFSGAMLPDTDTYVFSDYRPIQGVQTPFKIERYHSRNKIEEMQFSTVRYNVGLKDADFRR